MLILTGFNSAMAKCASYCIRSVERYLVKHPQYHFAVEVIPEDYARPASWHKVVSILKHLPDHDFVLWMDADSLLVGNQDLRSLLEDKTLNIARDVNGVNHGVAAWKNCTESLWALETMHRGYEEKKKHPWFEQSVLMEIENKLEIHYQEKTVFNAYPEDQTDRTQILHFPGVTPRDREPLMHRAYQKLIA